MTGTESSGPSAFDLIPNQRSAHRRLHHEKAAPIGPHMINLALEKRFPFDGPATYQIRVQGKVGPSWTDRLGGMTISLVVPETGPAVTTLEGELSDQAALLGVLNTLYEQHLTVLSVLCQDSMPASDTGQNDNSTQRDEPSLPLDEQAGEEKESHSQ
jgi:hypothetical protein